MRRGWFGSSPSAGRIHREHLTTPVGELSDFKIFKKIEINQLKKRIEEFYGWKGFTGKEIDQLFLERKPIEYELIEEHEAFADLVVGF